MCAASSLPPSSQTRTWMKKSLDLPFIHREGRKAEVVCELGSNIREACQPRDGQLLQWPTPPSPRTLPVLWLPRRLDLRSGMNTPLPVSLDAPGWESLKDGTETVLWRVCAGGSVHTLSHLTEDYHKASGQERRGCKHNAILLPWPLSLGLGVFLFFFKNNAVYETPQILKSAQGRHSVSEPVMKDDSVSALRSPR